MKNFDELHFDESVSNAQKVVDYNEKGAKVFKKAIFEFVSILLIVALFFYEYGELIVKEQDILIFIGNIAVMFVLSMLFDNNYRIKGKLVAISTEKYREAKNEVTAISKNITDKDITSINEKIEKYVFDKENKDIQNILYKVGVTKSDYDNLYKFLSTKELKKEKLKPLQIKGIKRARKVKKLKLSSIDLLSSVEKTDDFVSLGKSGKTLDKEHSIKSIITYLITAVVFAYFAVGLTKNFSLAAFGWYLLKVCFLVFRGIKSYFDSFLEIYEKGAERLNSQRALLKFFLGD